MVERFTGIPFGWKPEWEVVLLVTRLFMAGEIKLTMGGSDLDPRNAFDPLAKAVQHKQVSILKRKTADTGSINRVAELYRKLFSSLPRKDEDGVVADFRTKLQEWDGDLRQWLPLASQPHHPGKEMLERLLAQCGRQLAIRDPFEFIEALNASKDEWLDAGEDVNDVNGFYKNQLPTWQHLLGAIHRFGPNREVLRFDQKASDALKELDRIREEPVPYPLVSRIGPLIATVEAANETLVQSLREDTLRNVDQKIEEVTKALAQISASADLSNAALQPLQALKLKIASLASVPEIQYAGNGAGDRLDEAMDLIVDTLKQQQAATTANGKPSSSAASSSAATKTESAGPKPSQTIRPAEFWSKTYLETDTDVDTYLTELKAQLMAAIDAGKRIRIQ